jgi:general secretion pathway protein H
MPTARRSRRPAGGFTLIEVLVVLVIVGVVVAGVALSVGGQAERELENAAQRARALVELACERAELSGRDIGFAALHDGLRFGYFDPEGWKAMPSEAADELRQRALGEAITLRAERDGDVVVPGTAAGASPASLRES